MDVISLGFYAVICGCLAAASPTFGGVITRILAGVAVGLVAASVLPLLRSSTGY